MYIYIYIYIYISKCIARSAAERARMSWACSCFPDGAKLRKLLKEKACKHLVSLCKHLILDNRVASSRVSLGEKQRRLVSLRFVVPPGLCSLPLFSSSATARCARPSAATPSHPALQRFGSNSTDNSNSTNTNTSIYLSIYLSIYIYIHTII